MASWTTYSTSSGAAMHLPRQATGIFFYSMLPQLATRQCWILLLLYASLNSGWQFACAVWFLFSINSVKYEIALCWQDCFTEEIADDWLQWCSEVGVHTKLTPKMAVFLSRYLSYQNRNAPQKGSSGYTTEWCSTLHCLNEMCMSWKVG